jgi:hypothetical protein
MEQTWVIAVKRLTIPLRRPKTNVNSGNQPMYGVDTSAVSRLPAPESDHATKKRIGAFAVLERASR